MDWTATAKTPGSVRRGVCVLALFLVTLIAAAIVEAPLVLSAGSKVYTVARFPVVAQAKDAVTAKRAAMRDGQQRAFRSLLKRIVPVTSYGRLPLLKLDRIEDMIEGFTIVNEQNSRTEYAATLNYNFRARNIKRLLKSYDLPYVDRQGPRVLVVPHYLPTALPEQGTDDVKARKYQRDWTRAWRDLDLVHALVPLRLAPMSKKIHGDTINALMQGQDEALNIIAEEYDTKNILVALARHTEDGKVAVQFIGSDGVGRVNLTRKYKIYDGDFPYTVELAAIVGLGVLEGRWKALKAQPAARASASWDVQKAMRVEVEFSGLFEWQQIRRKLAETSGLDELKINRLSARGADISFNYAGDTGALQSVLGRAGLRLDKHGGGFTLSNQ